jgi:hypothetical protein
MGVCIVERHPSTIFQQNQSCRINALTGEAAGAENHAYPNRWGS